MKKNNKAKAAPTNTNGYIQYDTKIAYCPGDVVAVAQVPTLELEDVVIIKGVKYCVYDILVQDRTGYDSSATVSLNAV